MDLVELNRLCGKLYVCFQGHEKHR